MSKLRCIPILINKLANPVSSGGEAGYGAFLEPRSWITTEPKAQSRVTQQEDTLSQQAETQQQPATKNSTNKTSGHV